MARSIKRAGRRRACEFPAMPVTTEASSKQLSEPSQSVKQLHSQPPLPALAWPPGELSLRPLNLSKFTRKQLQEYFENTYDLDEMLFSSVVDEQYLYKCPDRLRLPLIFYLAHPATLYVNKLLLASLISKRVNASFEGMFETGVDEMCWDDTENYRMGGAYEWPKLSEVMEYRQSVRQLVCDVISSTPLSLPVTMDDPWWSVFMSLEHERIHLETSSVLIRQLPVQFVKRPQNWKYAPLSMGTSAGENTLVRVPAGKVTFGKPHDFPSYGWDNEYGQVEMNVPEFEASQYLVTNGEFLEFVESGGYWTRHLWTDEGWQWVEFRCARHPTFWVCSEGCKSGCGSDLASYTHCNPDPSQNGTKNGTKNGGDKYRYRAMFDVMSLPLDWPVEVNYHEAKAFCSWKGPTYRLPTEAEHHCIRDHPPPSSDASCDPAFQPDFKANINLRYGSSSPVNMFPANTMGFYDVYGNVWEWLEDRFNGLPGFKTHYLYDDFSSPCFDGRHTMMTGGSWVSTGNEASRFARFSFRRHFFQHLGFRVARSSSSSSPPPVRLCRAEVFVLGAGVTDNPVTVPQVEEERVSVASTNVQFEDETAEKLDETLQLQYGEMDSYAVPLVELVEEAVRKYSVSTDSLIDFGCATGLNSFLLSTTFQKVVGIDFCGRFIDAAMRIQAGKVVQYGSGQVAKLPSQAQPSQVQFKQLTWVPNELEGFSVAVFECVERLSEPRGWLYKLWEVVVPGGLLVFTTSQQHWNTSKLQYHIGKWFAMKETAVIGGRKIEQYFLETYHLDELLFTAIRDEQYLYKCPDRLRLPLIFYLAHPATLYVNKLLLASLISKRVNSQFETMFETGVNELSWDDTENYRMGGAYQWPTLSEVMEYRQSVRQLVCDVISSTPLSLPVTMDDPWWSVFMGIDHESQHIETTAVLLHQLPKEMVKRPDNWRYAPVTMESKAGENVFVKVPAGKVTLGKPKDFPSYGWDSDYGHLDVDVPEFEASQYLVTNGEFLEFVESGGYRNRHLWTDEGWQWVEFRCARHPTFWVCSEGCKSGCGSDLASYTHCNPEPSQNGTKNGTENGGDKYRYRAMFDVMSLPLDWPVEVNYHEAKAFCSWKGPTYRLPTEAEHHRIRDHPPPSSDASCDPAFQPDFKANVNLRYGSSSPVNMFPANSMGFYDVYGNVWEWLEDHYNGLPGFKNHYLYNDFSTTYCDGNHNMIVGGSWASSGSLFSRFCRSFFRRHFFQHCGFRVARSVSSPPPLRLCRAEVFVLGEGVTDSLCRSKVDGKAVVTDTANMEFQYETQAKLDEVLEQQYGQMDSYAVPLVELVEEAVRKYSVSTDSLIDFGCATGLNSFLLSTTFQKVVGIDFCGRFIDAAMRIQAGKVVQYGSGQVAKLPSQTQVQFKQLTWVPNELEGFSVAVFECVERLSEPRGWLYKLWEVVVPGGLLVFTTSQQHWNTSKLQYHIRKWFTLKETVTISGRQVSVWKAK